MVNIFMGGKITNLRHKLKITQEQLAEKMNVATTTVSRIENDGGVMRVDTMVAICEAFDITPNELLGWEPSLNEKIALMQKWMSDIKEIVENKPQGGANTRGAKSAR